MPNMSLKSRREYLIKMKPRYLKAKPEKKSAMLDEYCATTGLNRKYVTGCLSPKIDLSARKNRQRKKRTPTYGNNETYYLKKIWGILDYPCSQRLKPMIGEMINVLSRFNELNVPKEVEEKLLRISTTTIDEKLKKFRHEIIRKVVGTTKPGTTVKKTDTNPYLVVGRNHGPGFCELDTVAHCGSHAGGDFANTLNLTDILTGWCEQEALMGKDTKTYYDRINSN